MDAWGSHATPMSLASSSKGTALGLSVNRRRYRKGGMDYEGIFRTAGDADYAVAGFGYGAKDAPFAMTEELLHVPGMTHELFDRVAPDIIVYSPRFAAGA